MEVDTSNKQPSKWAIPRNAQEKKKMLKTL